MRILQQHVSCKRDLAGHMHRVIMLIYMQMSARAVVQTHAQVPSSLNLQMLTLHYRMRCNKMHPQSLYLASSGTPNMLAHSGLCFETVKCTNARVTCGTLLN